jgi:hypothetical protein
LPSEREGHTFGAAAAPTVGIAAPEIGRQKATTQTVKSMIRLCGEGEDMKWMKSMARQNLMVSAINTTLERDLITLGMRAFRAGGVRI